MSEHDAELHRVKDQSSNQTSRQARDEGDRSSAIAQAYRTLAQGVDQIVGWSRLPKAAGLGVLEGLRSILRQDNLHDTSHYPSVNPPPIESPAARHLTERTADGSYNDLTQPRMGMAGTRFGRNIPAHKTFPEKVPRILFPNPRDVSRILLTRHSFIPATSVNALVASWLQFVLRDFFSHGKGVSDDPWTIEVADDDTWRGDRPLTVPRTPRDRTRPQGFDGLPPTYINELSHWWDASQLYGHDLDSQRRVRTGADGKIRVPDTAPLPDEPRDPANMAGFWLGIGMMQILFSREHNSICDRLRSEYPQWSDEQLFQRARLINAALIAKIHTVEWTPAVINHPTTVAAMHINWYGIAGERGYRLFGRFSDSEVISGIPGGKTDHFGVPYSLTEEFVAVYRMHPLIPDDWSFRAVEDDVILQEATFRELAGPNAYDVLGKHSMVDLLYSFGTSHPGINTLHNFPRFLQEFERPDGRLVDLAATDILRVRELGVPRYNEFRRLMHLNPAKDFASLTDNPMWADELRRVYDDIEDVDLMVGMFAEPRPEGFAFSDTAFRVFILMASRRLNSDRFLTDDFTPQVYTQTGLDWVEDNTMMTVLLRHFPELAPAMRSTENAFAPWQRTARSAQQ